MANEAKSSRERLTLIRAFEALRGLGYAGLGLCGRLRCGSALRDQTVWEMFEAERPSLVPYVGRFDGFHAVSASVPKTVDVYVDRAVREQPLLGVGACGGAPSGDPGLRRADPAAPGRGYRW